MAEFRLPSLGADMDSGVLLEWRVHSGDTVHKGDIVAVVDTQKAAIEVECFTSGTVDRLLVEPGTQVPVGAVLATIDTGTEPAPAPSPEAPPLARPEPGRPPAAPQPSPPPHGAEAAEVTPLIRRLAADRHVDLDQVHGTGLGGRITRADVEQAPAAPTTPAPPAAPPRRKASPLARRLAAELGITLDQISGTGAGGAITADDVHRAEATAAQPRPTPTEAEQRAHDIRGLVAALMARSKREIPHYYLSETVDLAPAIDWMRQRNRELPVPERLIPAVLLIKAAAKAAATVGELNGFWTDDQFVPGEGVHLGVAIALRGGGLIAPAIHNADHRDLVDLMSAVRDLVARTRAGRIRRAEMSDPTITVSNLGDQGVESITGVIYPPQVALVGFGRIVDRPWAVDGLIGIRPTVIMSLAGDHRATDGAIGARYLRTVVQSLEHPEEL